MALPKLNQAGTTTRQYQLTARKGSTSFAQDGKQTSLWRYNNRTPGPLLQGKKGKFLEVKIINKLDQPAIIHSYGIPNLNAMDGVPVWHSADRFLMAARHKQTKYSIQPRSERIAAVPIYAF